MGYESDKLVYDYLSRVGDLAQATSLTAAERARLVARVRAEIDAERARLPRESEGAVRKLLKRVGSAEEIVRAAESGEAGAEVPASAPAEVPRVPRPEVPVTPAAPTPSPKPSSSAGSIGEWWRLPDDGHATVPDAGPGVPRMRGPQGADFGAWDRVELDFEIEEDEEEADEAEEAEDSTEPESESESEPEEEPAPAPKAVVARRLLRFRRGPSRATGPFLFLEALSALLLLAGAVLGLWYVAVLGWFAAYGSVKLGQTTRKFVALGVPGLTVVGGFVWLWLRSTGHLGSPLTHAQFTTAFRDMWPILLRVASAASSATLTWLIYRQRRL